MNSRGVVKLLKLPSPTLGACIEAYLGRPKYRARPSSDKVVAAYLQVQREIGHVAVNALDQATIDAWFDARGWADGTRRKMVAIVTAALNHAKRTRQIPDVPFFERPAPVAPKDVWLDETQEARVYALAMGLAMGKARLPRLTRFICLALDSGQRKAAILGLRWSQVDLDRGIIDFRLPGATSKKQSVLPIPARLRPMLERAHAERTSDYFMDTPAAIDGPFGTFMARAGLPDVTPHTLRHTAATLMLRAGVDAWSVSGILGNSPAMIMQVYGHHCPGHLLGAMERRFA
jgi:integrase